MFLMNLWKALLVIFVRPYYINLLLLTFPSYPFSPISLLISLSLFYLCTSCCYMLQREERPSPPHPHSQTKGPIRLLNTAPFLHLCLQARLMWCWWLEEKKKRPVLGLNSRTGPKKERGESVRGGRWGEWGKWPMKAGAKASTGSSSVVFSFFWIPVGKTWQGYASFNSVYAWSCMCIVCLCGSGEFGQHWHLGVGCAWMTHGQTVSSGLLHCFSLHHSAGGRAGGGAALKTDFWHFIGCQGRAIAECVYVCTGGMWLRKRPRVSFSRHHRGLNIFLCKFSIFCLY